MNEQQMEQPPIDMPKLIIPNSCLCLGLDSTEPPSVLHMSDWNETGMVVEGPLHCGPDGEKLEYTLDIAMLVTLGRQMRMTQRCFAGVYQDTTTGRPVHLVTDHTGQPIDGSRVPYDYLFVRIVPRWKVRGIVLGRIKSFYDFRLMLEYGCGDDSVSLEGTILVKSGRPDKPAVAVALDKLPLRFWKPKGTSLDELLALPWLAHAGDPLQEGDVNCPLDGPVKPIFGEYSSGRKEWRELCGRYYVHALCPKCLGRFGNRLLVMN